MPHCKNGLRRRFKRIFRSALKIHTVASLVLLFYTLTIFKAIANFVLVYLIRRPKVDKCIERSVFERPNSSLKTPYDFNFNGAIDSLAFVNEYSAYIIRITKRLKASLKRSEANKSYQLEIRKQKERIKYLTEVILIKVEQEIEESGEVIKEREVGEVIIDETTDNKD